MQRENGVGEGMSTENSHHVHHSGTAETIQSIQTPRPRAGLSLEDERQLKTAFPKF